jgi:D-ribose pyranase
LQVLNAIRNNFEIGDVYMAQEFKNANPPEVCEAFARATGLTNLCFEPHVEFKKRVPGAIGLIRTADTIPYANMIIVST